MRRRLGFFATVLFVVLAGCNAPAADSVVTPTESRDDESSQWTTVPSTPEPRRDVSNQTAGSVERTVDPVAVDVSGELPVDAGQTFARVRELLDSRTEPPGVKVYTGPTTGGTFSALQQDRFEAVLGIGNPRPVEESDLQVSGVTLPTGRIYLIPRGGREPEIERTLAHEFTHAVQFSQDARRELSAELPADRRDTADGALTERSVLEGAAVYTASEYVERYQLRYPTERTQIVRLYANATAGTKLYWSAYYHGAAYVSAHVDDPSELVRLYRSPPSTTEQLLHGTRDEPARLRVAVPGNDSPWTVTDRDSRGELFVRIVLGTEVPTDRASVAAAGWGNDEVLSFEDGAERSFAWVTRWDDPANATQFATVAARFLDGHATLTDGHWENDRASYRLIRLDQRTVVLLAGADRFVSGTAVREERGRVVVRPPDDQVTSDSGESERP